MRCWGRSGRTSVQWDLGLTGFVPPEWIEVVRSTSKIQTFLAQAADVLEAERPQHCDCRVTLPTSICFGCSAYNSRKWRTMEVLGAILQDLETRVQLDMIGEGFVEVWAKAIMARQLA